MAELDITCRVLTRETTAYLDGAMSPRLRTTFEQHLLFCPYCVVHLGQVRVTRQVLASLEGPAPPPETTRAVAEALGAGGG